MQIRLPSTRWLIIGTIVLILGGFLVYRSRVGSKTEQTFAPVTKQSIEQTIDVPGKVTAQTQANLRFLAGGKLVSLYVKEGDQVKKGEHIASIDAQDLQKNLSKSLNTYLSTRLDFEQSKDDRKDKAPTDKLSREVQKDQSSLENAVTDVELRDIAIRNATITSPITGVVTSLPVDTAGVQVLASDTFTIIDPVSLTFEAEVDETDIGSVSVGTPTRIVLDAYPDTTIEGTIIWIGLTARTSSQSSGGTIFPVRVSLFPGDLQKYRLGMNGTMTIISKKKDNVLSVPIDATTVREGKTYVQVKDPTDEKKLVEKEIQVGIENEDTVEVTSGLTEGEAVLLSK